MTEQQEPRVLRNLKPSHPVRQITEFPNGDRSVLFNSKSDRAAEIVAALEALGTKRYPPYNAGNGLSCILIEGTNTKELKAALGIERSDMASKDRATNLAQWKTNFIPGTDDPEKRSSYYR